MNVWIFNHYAESPDGSATRTFELCRALVRKGHETTVFASSFSHYRLREEHIDSLLRLSRTEVRDDVRFIWLRGCPYDSNDWRRIVNMMGYAVLALARALTTLPRPDVVIGCSVHPCAALAGLTLARLTAAPFVVEVPDLWPQVLIDFGRMTPGSVQARALRMAETVLYTAAERVIMLWRNTQDYVSGRGLDVGKIVWIPHVIDPARYENLPEYVDHGPPFTAMYLGSFVQSMALDVILDAAGILAGNRRDDVRIVLIGHGSDRDRLVARARSLGLRNVEIRDPIPKSRAPEAMAAADCLICSFKNSPVYQYGLSMSKLCDYLMSGRPIVMSGESTYDPVLEAHAGISVKGEDPEALAAALASMADLRFDTRYEMGRRGIAWAREHHDVNALADRLENVLLESLDGHGAPS